METDNPPDVGWLAAVQIPFVLLIAPAAGGYLGYQLDQWISSGPLGLAIGVLLGFFAAALRIRDLLRSMSKMSGGRGNTKEK